MRKSVNRDPRHKLKRQQQFVQYSDHACGPLTPADENVAISLKIARAASITVMASTAPAAKSGLYADPREDWLALRKEETIDPTRPISW